MCGDVLSESKALGAQMSVLQADAAVVVSARERHGDSGVGVLARSAGLSRREAAGQVQTAQSLQSMPAVRDAVEAGQISVANAKTLARASGKDECRPGRRRRRVVGEGGRDVSGASSPARLAAGQSSVGTTVARVSIGVSGLVGG